MAEPAEQNTPKAEEQKMPLLEHLIELRSRLMRSAISVLLMFFICYYFTEDIYNFLVQPLADVYTSQGRETKLIYTALHEAFFTYIKVAFVSALFLSFPIIATQLWKFIAPGLYKNERKAFLPFLVATPILFFAGGAMVYYLVTPMAYTFFLSFETFGVPGEVAIESLPKVDQYLSLIMTLIFAFGLCFELPVVMTLLGRVGMISSRGMREKRKYAIVAAFVAAAILTPPDVISQIMLAVPTILLYEVSIVSVRMIEKDKGINPDEEEDDFDEDDEEGEGEAEEAEAEDAGKAKAEA